MMKLTDKNVFTKIRTRGDEPHRLSRHTAVAIGKKVFIIILMIIKITIIIISTFY